MDIVFRVIGLLSAIFTGGLTILMVFTFRKARVITVQATLISVFLSLVTLPIFWALTGARLNLSLGFPLLVFGLILGLVRGQSMKMEYRGQQVLGHHSILYPLMWGGSLALSQLLNLLRSPVLSALGLAPVFLSTGTQVGYYGHVLLRRLTFKPTGDTSVAGISTRWITIGCGGFLGVTMCLSSALAGAKLLSILQPDQVRSALDVNEAIEATLQAQGATGSADLEPTGLVKPTASAMPTSALASAGDLLVWTRPDWAFLVDGPYELYVITQGESEVPQPLSNPITALDAPILSPDGNHLAYYTERHGNSEIYEMDLRTLQETRLTDHPANDILPAWSPDAEWIAFTSDREGSQDLFSVHPDGADLTRLTSDSAAETWPVWSPDGRSIAFLSDRDGENDLYVINSDGTGERQLTDLKGEEWGPVWSPDGTRLAVVVSQMEGDYRDDIYLVAADGSWTAPLAVSGQDWMPTWSPDGTQLAFESQRDGNSQIYRIQADGSDERNLSQNSWDDSMPYWSLKGDAIAYISWREDEEGTTIEIYRMQQDGSQQRQLTFGHWPEDQMVSALQWAP